MTKRAFVPSNGYSITVEDELGKDGERKIIGIARRTEVGGHFQVFRGPDAFIEGNPPTFVVNSELLAFQLIKAATYEDALTIFAASQQPASG